MYNSSLDKRPRRNPVPTTKLLDTNNTERAGLPFQLKSIHDHRAAHEPDVRDAPTGTSFEYPDATSFPGLSGSILEKRPFSAIDGDTTPDSVANSTDHPVHTEKKTRS
jgi:hypothetical protein